MAAGVRETSPRAWPTVPEIAASVGERLRAGDEDAALRLLLDGVLRLPLPEAASVPGALQAPPSTGDERWDTLLATVVARTCRQAGVPVPAWTRCESLPRWWWPGAVGARRAQVVQRTPIDFRRVGIWFDERNLVSP
ncbi:MAG: hypothetical protein ACFCVG_06055 [Kineosporiaceae bacterium]